jgi:hypothetical protein
MASIRAKLGKLNSCKVVSKTCPENDRLMDIDSAVSRNKASKQSGNIGNTRGCKKFFVNGS